MDIKHHPIWRSYHSPYRNTKKWYIVYYLIIKQAGTKENEP